MNFKFKEFDTFEMPVTLMLSRKRRERTKLGEYDNKRNPTANIGTIYGSILTMIAYIIIAVLIILQFERMHNYILDVKLIQTNMVVEDSESGQIQMKNVNYMPMVAFAMLNMDKARWIEQEIFENG